MSGAMGDIVSAVWRRVRRRRPTPLQRLRLELAMLLSEHCDEPDVGFALALEAFILGGQRAVRPDDRVSSDQDLRHALVGRAYRYDSSRALAIARGWEAFVVRLEPPAIAAGGFGGRERLATVSSRARPEPVPPRAAATPPGPTHE